MTWTDVYSRKPEEYLEMIAKGEVPKWDSETKKWVSNSMEQETFGNPQTPTPVSQTTTYVDPQADQEVDDDLPF